jgi:hypothetical protein
MTVTIELSPEIEASLAAQAAVQGISLQQYLQHLLEEQVPSRGKPMTPGERAALWRQSTASLPRTPPLSDQAVSRETIYDTRG